MRDWLSSYWIGSTWQKRQAAPIARTTTTAAATSSSWHTCKTVLACCCFASVFNSGKGDQSTMLTMKGSSSHWIHPAVPNSLGKKIPYLDSNGDYVREQWFEDPRLPLYSKQSHLPRLPVPTLEETIATFLPTAMPLALDNYDADGDGATNERATLEAACQAFPAQADYLQKRLLKRAHLWNDKKHSSWLQQWWNQKVYLEYRDPNVIHVSYFFRPSLSHTVHETQFHLQPHAGSLLLRGAIVLQAAVRYADLITTGRKAPTVIGHGSHTTVLCSTPYKYLFHSCRIPAHPADFFRVYKAAAASQPLHALVICHNQFFAVPVTDSKGKPLSLTTLQKALDKVIARAFAAVSSSSSSSPSSIPELGWLTCSPRDTWATNYRDLFLQHPDMAAALETLQSSVSVLALDLSMPLSPTRSPSSSSSSAAATEQAKRLWHGNVQYSANRWHDKSGHVILDAHGVLGYVGEHAMADGMPAADFCQYLLEQLVSIQQEQEEKQHKQEKEGSDEKQRDNHSNNNEEQEDEVAEPVLIFEQAFQNMSQEHRAKIDAAVEAAKQEMLSRIADNDLELLNYETYGRNEMKQAGYAPDAYIQMALQLASYRLFGHTLVGTYEATQTRKFLHGRTETTRTVSPHSLAFCRGMTEERYHLSTEDKQALLHAAIDSHVQFTHKAVDGKGVDRHFFGLRCCLQQGDTVPDLFQHPLFTRSKTWRLSTSTVPQAAPGFGTVEPNGVGIGYDLRNDGCIFSIAALTKTGYVHRLAALLTQALDEMAALCRTADSEESSTNTFLRLVN